MKKKVLSLVLVMVMVLVALPLGAVSVSAASKTEGLEQVSLDNRRVFKENYLTFTAEEDNSTVVFRFIHASGVLYRTKSADSDQWSEWQKPFNGPFYKTIVLEHAGDQVQYIAGGFTMSLLTPGFSMTGKIAASGSVTSLLDYNGGNPYTEVKSGAFEYLFANCSALTTAPELPSLKVGPNAYKGMFLGCDSLEYAPSLPAVELGPNCYKEMFAGCTSLNITYEYSEEYACAWIIPEIRNLEDSAKWNKDMFAGANESEKVVILDEDGSIVPQENSVYYQKSLKDISLAEISLVNGKTAYTKRANEVTILPFPEDGYVVDSIRVYKTGDEETEVEVKDYKFEMPEYPVTIEVVYTVPFTDINENTATVTVRDYHLYNVLALIQGRFGVEPEENVYVVYAQDNEEYAAWFYDTESFGWSFVEFLTLDDLLNALETNKGYVIGSTTENPISSQFTFEAPEDLLYDGQEKEAVVTAKTELQRAITLRYFDAEGTELEGKPVNAGVYTVKIDVEKGEKYEAIEGLEDESWTFEIAKRTVTIKCDSATKRYDGVALRCLAVIEGGDGFIEGEGAEYEYISSLTKVGKTANQFTYTLKEGTLEGNYEITTEDGNLNVTLSLAQENTKDITKDNVTLKDKDNVEKAIADYEKLLKEEELTEEEKTQHGAELNRLKDALQAIENAEAVIKQISELPASTDLTVEDNDKVLAALEAYNKLTENEKKMVGEVNLQLVQQNNEKIKELVDISFTPEILEGANQTISQITSKEASFRSEAPLYQFMKVVLDGEELAGENYDLTEGSTIVTLKADFVKTLKNGEHSIEIVSKYGTAKSTFVVKDYYFWLIAGLSAAVVVLTIILIVNGKKNKKAKKAA